MYDVIVVGGGPAGMTAALYALRNGKSALVVEKHGFGGQITYSPKVENFPGTLSMSGNEFADHFLEQIMAQGADVELTNQYGVKQAPTLVLVDGENFEKIKGVSDIKGYLMGLKN